MKFLGDEGVKALEAAVAEIENASAVEIVLAVRPRARHWLVQHALVALAAGIGVLAVLVFGHHVLAPWLVLALPVAAAVIGALLVEVLPPLYRFLAPGELRDEHVREAARSAFVANRVHTTRGRTGLLVFMAVRERRVELVGDTALEGAPLAAWSKQLAAALPDGPAATAKVLASFAPALAAAAPRRGDDANELPDAPIRS